MSLLISRNSSSMANEAWRESSRRTSLESSSPRNSTSHSTSSILSRNLLSVFMNTPANPSGNHFRKSGMEVSRNCSRVFRTQIALERRMPSRHGAIFLAWYRILTIPAVVLVLPTGPHTREMNFSDRKNGTRLLTGENLICPLICRCPHPRTRTNPARQRRWQRGFWGLQQAV